MGQACSRRAPSSQPEQPQAAIESVTGAAGSPAKPPGTGKIWILCWGTFGDHEPAVALAKGLLERRHEVKVFGVGRFRGLFGAYAVPFGALDAEMMLHPGNSETRRKLEEFAGTEGFAGPDRAEDLLMDTYILTYEFMARADMQELVDGKPHEERAAASEVRAKMLDELVMYSKSLGVLLERRAQHSAFVLAQTGRSGEGDCLRRGAFAGFLRRTARELVRDPFDLLHTLNCVFRGQMWFKMNRLTKDGLGAGAQGKLLRELEELVAFFYSWLDRGEELEQYLGKYWEECCAKLFAFDSLGSRGSRTLETGQIVAVHNVALAYQATPADERPDIIIAQHGTVPAGLWLHIKHGADIVPWWPQLAFRRLPGFLNYFERYTNRERSWEPPRPLTRYGSLPLLDLLRGDRFLFSLSPLLLQQCDISLQHARACCTGQWVLDHGPCKAGEGGGFFGSVSEQGALEAFLAEGPPIYLGWGSNPAPAGAQALANLVVRTLRLVGMRGIFVVGASGVEQWHVDEAFATEYEGDTAAIQAAQGRLLRVRRASHSALLPRCACLVHHGGMGTCHAALRSGVPSVVTGALHDQPSNAGWVQSLGCGLKEELKADALATAVSRVLGDRAMQAKAKEIAQSMASERGVAAAAEIIERCLREPGPTYVPSRPSSCKDGVYGLYDPASSPRVEIRRVHVKGTWLCSAGGRPIGMIRGGRFTIGRGESAAIYDTQLALHSEMAILYGSVGEDGKTVALANGKRLELVADAP